MWNTDKIFKRWAMPIVRKFVACMFALLLLPALAHAQDKIYMVDNSVLETKVQEVGEAQIKYKKFSNLNGPVYVVDKAKVKMVVYENGEKEVYNQVAAPTKSVAAFKEVAIDSL